MPRFKDVHKGLKLLPIESGTDHDFRELAHSGNCPNASDG